ncbi:hypothetical protein FDT66_01990 [Polaribacter aestuariivivens]|uniref:Uncharacterized protein n=1 Tax=Polaribacter aestuariivivens TaxID=2304626 RepID=A0A5S3NAC0_9FLAO|nr:hypothetical protein [Polaribacter aestuariivivens]TMM32258.1 hypothetical protein FDT66_01990 [Polaribacter aestuariivivens]
MTFLQKIKQPLFWSNFAKVAIPFFILVTLISLFMNSWREIFAGDFAKVNEVNFANGKWKTFWGLKIVISVFYGIWVTSKKMK